MSALGTDRGPLPLHAFGCAGQRSGAHRIRTQSSAWMKKVAGRSYAERKAKREQEIEGLKEALNILEG